MATDAAPLSRRRGILDILFFSWANNVWFGVGVLVALFIYSSLGSALPPLRQHPLLDMTEMEWFHWWPFDVLIALICVTLTTVTLKQIPLRWVNAGVWTIHLGIIVLCAGSVFYFSTKLEGDAPIYRRRALITVPGATEPSTLVIRPNSRTTVTSGAQRYQFSITRIIPDWTLVSGDDKGKTTTVVWVNCQTPTEQFTRQLLVGYPQYTEDILADGTRAKKRPSGDPLVDHALDLKLDYMPQTEFFLMDSSAIFTRLDGDERWIERSLDELPRYHDHVASHDELSEQGDRSMPLRSLDIVVPPAEESGDPLADYEIRVKAYLRYAFPATTWRGGGGDLNPAAGITLSAGPDARLDYELLALDPDLSTSQNGQIAFRWIESPETLHGMLDTTQGRLAFHFPGADDDIVIPIDDIPAQGAEAPFTPIADTGMAFRVRSIMQDLLVQSGAMAGKTMSVATLEIKMPDRTITRFVSNVPGASRDVGEDGQMMPTDSAIDAVYQPGGVQTRVTLVSGPPGVGTWILFKEHDGSVTKTAIAPGASIDATDEVQLTLRYLIPDAVKVVKPRVIPLEKRDRNARRTFSMIRVEISKGDWTHTMWLEHNDYALPNAQYAVPRRITFNPSRLSLPDGRTVELLYSRDRRPLPAPIALESFALTTHTGGYTGATITVRDFISQLRFKTASGWSDSVQMSSNRPASNGGYWFFQSTWDPPAQGYAGMNFTGVGVGNRNGVHIQLAGTCIAVVGMLFAFYVKPTIRRRMQDRAQQGGTAVKDGRQLPPRKEQAASLHENWMG